VHHAAHFSRPKQAAFVRSRGAIELPNAPGGLFRQQGLSSCTGKSKGGGRFLDMELPVERERRVARTEIISASTRPTCSTGDVTRAPDFHRPSACDRPHRQPLRGHLRGSELHSHRPSRPCTGPPQSLVEFKEDSVHEKWESPDEDEDEGGISNAQTQARAARKQQNRSSASASSSHSPT
jgi:hypothetical protein